MRSERGDEKGSHLAGRQAEGHVNGGKEAAARRDEPRQLGKDGLLLTVELPQRACRQMRQVRKGRGGEGKVARNP